MPGKRPRFFLLPLLLCALLTLSACAAESAAGSAESFYSEHAAQCVQDGRRYALNGAPGYITVCRSPEDAQPTDYLLNEGLITVSCTWQGAGGEWGLLRYRSLGKGAFLQGDGNGDAGWVRMSELALQYNKDLFVREHLDEFVFEEVTLDMRDYDTVYLWPYPGSGGRAEVATWYIRTERDNLLTFPAYWTDSLDRRWGGYSFFDADGFICLDEPGLEENTLPEVDTAHFLYPAADSRTLPRPRVPSASSYTMAAIAAVLTVLLLFSALLWRRRRRKLQEW